MKVKLTVLNVEAAAFWVYIYEQWNILIWKKMSAVFCIGFKGGREIILEAKNDKSDDIFWG